MAKKKEKSKKRVVSVDTFGQVHIQATFNNIIISMTNKSGQVVSWSSAGKMGFRGAKKNTPYAAQVAAEDCGKKAFDLGMKEANVLVKGTGAGRESAIRTINDVGILINEIKDMTPIPHGGCRPPKRRRP